MSEPIASSAADRVNRVTFSNADHGMSFFQNSYENKLSVVFENIEAARVTLDRVREFVSSHPTVYCGTHTPQGYENLEAKRVMNLDNPVPTVLADVDFSKAEATGKYVCSICGDVYNPAEHDGVAFEDLPDDWKCPRCRQTKENLIGHEVFLKFTNSRLSGS